MRATLQYERNPLLVLLSQKAAGEGLSESNSGRRFTAGMGAEMDLADDGGSRFAAYVEGLVSVIGHKDREGPLRDYCLGLMMPCERKSVEPLAAVTAPARAAAQHQSLLHFVGAGGWSDERVLAKVREMVLPQIEQHGAIAAWIIDDTSFPKQGRHSVGVARQYCGQLGKQDNCQVAVSLSLANRHASLPVAYRLYLPREWASDRARRRKTGVPEEIAFKTKPEIALDQLRWACAAGLPRGVALLDAGYGNNSDLRAEITALGLTYAAGILSTTTVWAPGARPLPAKTWSGRGRPPKLMRRDDRPVSVKALALGLPKRAWRTIEWREGAAEPLRSRFARLRVRAAHRDEWRVEPRPEEWLLIEWPKGESEPTKYWVSTLPQNIAFPALVDFAKLRWRIERDYQELKQEVGLGHFEGRGWRGFHHHATLCIAAYGFLISERATIPPSANRSARMFPGLALSTSYRPRRSAAATRTPRAKLNRHHATTPDRRPRQDAAAMPMLRGSHCSTNTTDKNFVTQ
jgi:SRSO17 transposase